MFRVDNSKLFGSCSFRLAHPSLSLSIEGLVGFFPLAAPLTCKTEDRSCVCPLQVPSRPHRYQVGHTHSSPSRQYWYGPYPFVHVSLSVRLYKNPNTAANNVFALMHHTGGRTLSPRTRTRASRNRFNTLTLGAGHRALTI
ncbi:unnamed protein product [Ectocarpus sp. 12 AP-2014]